MEKSEKLATVIVEDTVVGNRKRIEKTTKRVGKEDGTEFHQTVTSKGDDGRTIVVKTVTIRDPA